MPEDSPTHLRARLRLLEKHGETLPQMCAYCETFFSDEDRERAEAGEPVSHGICTECQAEHFPDAVEEG